MSPPAGKSKILAHFPFTPAQVIREINIFLTQYKPLKLGKKDYTCPGLNKPQILDILG